jgi:hypothetical protein
VELILGFFLNFSIFILNFSYRIILFKYLFMSAEYTVLQNLEPTVYEYIKLRKSATCLFHRTVAYLNFHESVGEENPNAPASNWLV